MDRDVFQKKQGKRSYLLLFIALLVIVISVEGFLLSRRSGDEVLPETGEEQPTSEKTADEWLADINGSENFTKIALVGKEYLFEDDVKGYFSSQGRIGEYEENGAIDQDVFDYLINVSVALQEAEKRGWLTLESDYFNNPKKDHKIRGQKYNDIQLRYMEDMEGHILVEGNSVWFKTVTPTVYILQNGEESSKSLARSKIEAVYARVKDGEITVEQAGEILRNDPEVQELNPVGHNHTEYSSASYFRQIYSKYEDLSSGYELAEDQRQLINSLSTGELTPIILGKDNFTTNGISTTQDAYFIYYRAIDSERNAMSFEAWVSLIKSDYEIQKL